MNRWLTGTWPRAAVAAVSLAAPMLAAALPACASTLPGPPARALGAAAHGAGPALAPPGPGAALALARPAGQRSLAPRYVPDAVGVSRSELARCPLTVVDLGAVPAARGRAAAVRADDRRLGQIAAAIPRGGLLVVAAPADA